MSVPADEARITLQIPRPLASGCIAAFYRKAVTKARGQPAEQWHGVTMFDFWSLFLQLVVSVVLFALFRWAKSLQS